MSGSLGILFIGDIIGRPGRGALRAQLPLLRERFSPDIVIANGENAAGGVGITAAIADEILDLGVDVLTSGNHIWDKPDTVDYIDTTDRLIRPANYPEGTPGRGSVVFKCASGVSVAVLNLSGRVFMGALDCPFSVGEREVERLREQTPIVFVDMHAEATSEKGAMGWFLDGRVSAVVGTHTHVQTADERILPKGTAFITDAGMTGPTNSVIGVKKELVLKKFLTNMPVRFEVAKSSVELQGVFIVVGNGDGKARSIERIKLSL